MKSESTTLDSIELLQPRVYRSRLDKLRNTMIPYRLVDPDLSIEESWIAWNDFQGAGSSISSRGIDAPAELVVSLLANPRNEDWYPSKKERVRLLPTELRPAEPDFDAVRGHYQSSDGHFWQVHAQGMRNEITYDISDNKDKVVRLIASPLDANDITWVVFYHVRESGGRVFVTMTTFFIGLPKLGVSRLGRGLRWVLDKAFHPLLWWCLNFKLKRQAERLSHTYRMAKLSAEP